MTIVATKEDFDFYRCYKCGRLITRHEEWQGLRSSGQICPCGSLKYSPANPLWYEFFYPRLWVYAALKLRGVYK